MKITVHYSTKTGTIKQAFNRMFPYLKIEFFKQSFGQEETRSGVNMVVHNMFVGEINGALKEGTIIINGDGKAAVIKEIFQKQFGLPVQIFRKYKKSLIATTTDELTLSQENDKVKETYDTGICTAMGS